MEEENKETNVKSTIDAVTGLVKAVPVYEDAVQPAAKEIGKSLETVSKAVNVALAPIKAMVWGYEKIEFFLTKRISEKLKDIPKEDIQTPPPNIAGPAVESMRYTGHDENLRELYANLLANSMNKSTSKNVHPAFVEVIKNLSSEDAKILQLFLTTYEYPKIDILSRKPGEKGKILNSRNFTHFHLLTEGLDINLIPTYIDNLNRLGILQIIDGAWFEDSNFYLPLENDKAIDTIRNDIKRKKTEIIFERGMLKLTSFGKSFVKNVVS